MSTSNTKISKTNVTIRGNIHNHTAVVIQKQTLRESFTIISLVKHPYFRLNKSGSGSYQVSRGVLARWRDLRKITAKQDLRLTLGPPCISLPLLTWTDHRSTYPVIISISLKSYNQKFSCRVIFYRVGKSFGMLFMVIDPKQKVWVFQ